ncbi:MAG TPA: chromate transporter [Tissierellia bacterium]|nr:chromate transporter [Tissierellia bacterium]
MEKNLKFYWTLFISTFSLSAFTIGGGYVIVPLMRKKFVEELKWIDEEEMLNLVAICQSAPGPIAVNTSIMVGYRLAGLFGALLTTIGTVLPPLIIITIIAKFYTAFKENTIVNALLLGMRAGVAAVILDVIIKMTDNIIKSKNLISLAIMIVAFIAAVIIDVNAALIIVLSGAFGGFYYNYFKKAGGAE